MAQRNAGLIADPLFVGATRPPMRWGVTYAALLFNMVFTLEAFLVTRNLLTLLLCAPIHSLWLPRYAAFVYQSSLRDRHLGALFAPDAVLVPVPGSARSGQAPWAAYRLAVALAEVGFALHVWTGLRRQCAVTKSATAPSAGRPTVRQHYDSFEVTMPAPNAIPRLVLIDDVITKGRTLLAAAARLRAELPLADIRGFALIRTEGFVQQIKHLEESCHGVVRWARGDARREP